MNYISEKLRYLLCFLCCVDNSNQSAHPVMDIATIAKSKPGSTLGIVHGVQKCGGNSEFIQFRVGSCDPKQTCRFPANGESDFGEIDFISPIDVKVTKFQMVCQREGGPMFLAHDQNFDNVSLIQGEKFTLRMKASATPDNNGTKAAFDYLLGNDSLLILCVHAVFEFV